nr:putative clathrin heavy chain [Quercus suber]
MSTDQAASPCCVVGLQRTQLLPPGSPKSSPQSPSSFPFSFHTSAITIYLDTPSRNFSFTLFDLCASASTNTNCRDRIRDIARLWMRTTTHHFYIHQHGAASNQVHRAGPAYSGFNSCTLESDSFVCVRQKADENAQPEVLIINLKNGNSVMRRPIKADNAIMHWNKEIIALKAGGKTLQIFDLAQKSKIKSTTMSEDVVYWKWFSESTLGLVTDSSVYHWNIFDASQVAPAKVFDRNPNLAGCQIINYSVSDDEKWMVVVGITQQNNRVVGNMQLYSRDRGISQAIEGHAAAFGTMRLEDAPADTKLFTFANRTATGAKLHIVEVDHTAPNPQFTKKAVDLYFPAEANSDFPVAMQVSRKYKVIYMITKYGFIHLFDLETGSSIFVNRISSDTIFTMAGDQSGSGIVAVNRKGQVLSVSVDESTVIPYLLQNAENAELAYKLASRAGLQGADQLYQQRFDQLLNMGDYQQAAKTAANSPQGFLRTPQTIERFKAVPQQQGQLSVILQYFGMLLDKGKLNQHETLELARPVLAQNRKHLLEKWMKEGKLGCSEQLGDLVRMHDLPLAQSIYQEAGASQKVIAAMAESGNFDQIIAYSRSVGYTPDYNSLIQHVVRINPEKGAEFATALAKEDINLIDIDRTVDIFQSQGMVQQATAFLLDVLAANNPEQGHLQTRLLEMNLLNAPQVADAILGNEMFTHYDRPRIAQLCENAGLLTRALEHYDDPASIKRCITQSDKIPPEFLVGFFGRLTVDLAMECLDEMLKVNIRQNLQAVIDIAKKYSDLFGPNRIIDLLEKYRTAEGLYFYLGGIVNISEDKDVTFKYIEAATKMGQLNEVERVCRDSSAYDPEKVKNFLKEQRLTEQLPLIIVCDRFDFIHDLVLFLYKNQQFKSIEVYVQRVNPSRTPAVVGGLLDVDCDESIIKGLLNSVDPSSIPIDTLVSEVESRNRLKLLLPFLEATLAAGNQQPAIYNALAKIYIDSNNNPEKFLKENDLYDTLAIGKYCEKRDPNLAYIAYRKGQNDLELISITNDNAMYRPQARYLLERSDSEIWQYVLSENNIHRRSLLDQVISTAVPECQEPEQVSIAVGALIQADLPGELIELLERIILEPTMYSDNASLQNLLMLTAAKSDRGRVAGYIQQLENYSPGEIAHQCVEVGMYEEAFLTYKKANDHGAATDVLVNHIISIDRAQSYADEIDTPEVWSKVAKAQLDGLRVTDSIESYMRAQDPSNYPEVIETATHAGKDDDLIKYLRMARKTLREPAIDTALAFCFARTDQLPELEEFLRGTNVADIEVSGDKAYAEGHHEAAKIFFSSISNWAKLATTLVHLNDYQGAVECARKANNVKVWKQVNEACVAKKEFRLAQICGLNLIVDADELTELVKQYERNGYFDELISLLEAGLGLERAHMGLFTALGVALSKYHPERVMEHLRIFWGRINIPKMINACEIAHLWPELVFLYAHYDEFDNAALAMMERAADAWEHHTFKETIVKVANLEIYYRALNFYLQEQPSLITDLLQALTPRIDVNRVVRMFEKSDNIPLIKPFLLNVQSQNKRAVNDAINDLLIEEEDYKQLRDSAENFDNYEAVALAQRLEKHDLIFFRQIAANIYRKNKRWDKSIQLSKQDKLYRDAIETAAMSGKSDVVEELLRYFVDIGSRECFAGMLYSCYDLIPLHTVMEMSWRHGLHDFTMPFMINFMSQQASTIETLRRDNEERKTREASEKKEEDTGPILGQSRLMLTQGPIQQAPPPMQMNGYMQPQATGYRGF